MKTHPLEVDLFNADGHVHKQTDGEAYMTKLNSRFSLFCERA